MYKAKDFNGKSSFTRLMIICMALWCVTAFVTDAAPNTPEGKTLAASKETIQIADAGKAKLSIVISPESSDSLKETAKELASYLKRITGADFAIKEGKTPAGITLGTLAQFPDESLKAPLEIKEKYDGIEAFAIQSDKGCIRLIGNTDLGASHAAHRLLELLGCRWFFMGKTWEVIPEIQNLSFDLNETDRPIIWSRNIWFSRLNRKGEDADPDRQGIFAQWKKSNRMAESLETKTSHNWNAIPSAFKDDGYPYRKEFEAHPEYFALVDGKRTPPQFCVTNPSLQKVIMQYATRYFEKNPNADMVSLDTADQPGWCICPECTKLGYHSNQAFYLANLVAKELQKVHPGKYVGLLAYSWHSDPPDFTLEKNVFVQLTSGMNASKYSFEELFKLWSEKCAHLGIYEYFSYWEMDKCMLPGTGVQNKIDDLGPRFKKYADNHVINICPQASNNWGVNGFGYYIANKMMWNPSSDIKFLKRDFYDKAFGPAAPAMERYFERLNLSNIPFRGQALLPQCLMDLEEATVLAKAKPDILARLDDLKANLIYNYLGQKVENAENETEQRKYALEWFTWSYRTRNNHMNDWISFRSSVGNSDYKNTLAFKLKEPSWNFRKTKDNPWKNNDKVTSQELSEWFQKIKTEYGAIPSFTEKKYSERFVLVQTESNGKEEKNLSFTGTAVQLLASMKGEPLCFKLVSMPSQLERQEAKYSLATLEGNEIIKGELTEGENRMELKVPGPGIYRFTCKRGGKGWAVELPDALNSALVVNRKIDFRPQHMTAYFYVPKKTSVITMHVQWGFVTVFEPDNNVAYKGQSKGEFISIPVSAGMDGRVWRIRGKFRNLWFLNIPTVMSSNPKMIFIPEELATKDGLNILIK